MPISSKPLSLSSSKIRVWFVHHSLIQSCLDKLILSQFCWTESERCDQPTRWKFFCYFDLCFDTQVHPCKVKEMEKLHFSRDKEISSFFATNYCKVQVMSKVIAFQYKYFIFRFRDQILLLEEASKRFTRILKEISLEIGLNWRPNFLNCYRLQTDIT